MFSLWISAAVFGSAGLSIVGDRPQNRTLHYIFKPLTMVILIVTLISSGSVNSTFTYLMLAGLVLSLCGDVFLMLPKDRFIAGLVSFLLAHIAYIAAFSTIFAFTVTWWWLLIVVALSVGYFGLLSSSLGKLKVAVLFYVAVISAMLWLAGEIYMADPSSLNLLLIVGASTFAVSDACLAWNKFKAKYSGAQTAILSTYFLAQWLLCQAAVLG